MEKKYGPYKKGWMNMRIKIEDEDESQEIM